MSDKNQAPYNNIRNNKKRTEDITMEELRTLPCYQNTNEAELQAIVEFVKGFCDITFGIWKQQSNTGLNKSISIKQPKQNKAA